MGGRYTRNGVQDNAIKHFRHKEVATCFNSSTGNEKYNEGADLNSDGAVNMNDIMICCRTTSIKCADD
jgi:hypothetical protein